MNGKIDFRIPIIILLTLILIIMCYFYFKDDNGIMSNDMQFNISDMSSNSNNDISSSNNLTIISATSEVGSSLTENIELHATYYLEESYIQLNQVVKAGENILKYTNGTYLTAPYDCVITQINIPNEDEQCTNEHCLQISSVNNLMVQFNVDESKIKSIMIGQSATIEIKAYEDKILEGNITNISSTANNGKFTVTVEFENKGNIMLGMTADVEIKKE